MLDNADVRRGKEIASYEYVYSEIFVQTADRYHLENKRTVGVNT